MNEELRERIAQRIEKYTGQEPAGHVAGLVLGEIEAAGYGIVDLQLLERIVNDAASCVHDCIVTAGDWQAVKPWAGWMPS